MLRFTNADVFDAPDGGLVTIAHAWQGSDPLRSTGRPLTPIPGPPGGERERG